MAITKYMGFVLSYNTCEQNETEIKPDFTLIKQKNRKFSNNFA